GGEMGGERGDRREDPRRREREQRGSERARGARVAERQAEQRPSAAHVEIHHAHAGRRRVREMAAAPPEYEVDAVPALRERAREVEPDPLRAGAVRAERPDEQREVAPGFAHRAPRKGAKTPGSTKRFFFSRNDDFCQKARNESSTKSK